MGHEPGTLPPEIVVLSFVAYSKHILVFMFSYTYFVYKYHISSSYRGNDCSSIHNASSLKLSLTKKYSKYIKYCPNFEDNGSIIKTSNPEVDLHVYCTLT